MNCRLLKQVINQQPNQRLPLSRMFAQQYYPAANAYSAAYGPSYDTYYQESYDDMYYYSQPAPSLAPTLGHTLAPALAPVAKTTHVPLPPRSNVIEFPKVSIHTLYIPYISDNYSVEDIRNIFSKYSIAMVKDVDFVMNMNYNTGLIQRSAYIYIDYWFYSRVSANFVERLNSENNARLVVNDPEYWIILPSTAKKHIYNGRKLRIDLDVCNNHDIPPLVNTMVSDEYTAYEYEQLKRMTSDDDLETHADRYIDYGYEEDIPFESDAVSYMDTLDLGLRHEDDRFSDESIEEYHRDRNSYRKSEYSKY